MISSLLKFGYLILNILWCIILPNCKIFGFFDLDFMFPHRNLTLYSHHAVIFFVHLHFASTPPSLLHFKCLIKFLSRQNLASAISQQNGGRFIELQCPYSVHARTILVILRGSNSTLWQPDKAQLGDSRNKDKSFGYF